MSDYRSVVIETYKAVGEPSGKKIRARPLAGQGLPTDMHVECSSSMRKSHPVGTKFLIKAKVTNREDGPPFLYTSWRWRYEVLSDEQATAYLKG